jgi:hypothetical protein
MVAAVTPQMDAGMCLPAEHFAIGAPHSHPLVEQNLQQPVRKNKTIGLVMLKGSEADGG